MREDPQHAIARVKEAMGFSGIQLGELVALWGQPLMPSPARQGASAAGSGGVLTEVLTGVSTDSRRLEPGNLFIPLVGERFDGHGFLESLLVPADGQPAAPGAALAQGDRLDRERAAELVERSGRPLWLVADTLQAYQELALFWRRRLALPVVAVTGSAGKTTTRELIRAALAPLGPVVASSGNENNDVGAPLTLLKAGPETAAVVVEMGMRGPGEIERLSRCAEPDVAVITNIGTAHIGRLGSREAIACAKVEICSALKPGGVLVIPAADPLLEGALAGSWSGRVERVALADEPQGLPGGPEASWVGELVEDGRALQVKRRGEASPNVNGAGEGSLPTVQLPLAGRHNGRNLLLALAVAAELGVPLEALSAMAVEVPGGRNRRLEMGGVSVLDETYNASPEAVLAALQLLAESRGNRRFAVLGTMLELGEQSLALHQQVASRAKELGLDGLVVVDGGAEGDAMVKGAEGLPCLVRVSRPEEAAEPLLHWLEAGDVLLLKGSRGVALETLLPLLREALEKTDVPFPSAHQW
jgi:UDP-N-acetylmuramoyl-tripeptide--D-alanyl-D-alanine ligase